MRAGVVEVLRAREVLRVFVDWQGQRFELASFRGGPIEVYVVADGLASFRCYLDAIASTATRAALVAAWVSGQGAPVALGAPS